MERAKSIRGILAGAEAHSSTSLTITQRVTDAQNIRFKCRLSKHPPCKPSDTFFTADQLGVGQDFLRSLQPKRKQ
jgi:hypothetical protein